MITTSSCLGNGWRWKTTVDWAKMRRVITLQFEQCQSIVLDLVSLVHQDRTLQPRLDCSNFPVAQKFHLDLAAFQPFDQN